MTAEDRWTAGYRAADRYHKTRAAKIDRALRAWADPGKAKVRGLVRKHWPSLAAALDELEEAS